MDDFSVPSPTTTTRRTLHELTAKIYICLNRSFELTGQSAAIRGDLLFAHRTACLHHNDIGQATIINLILRNYLQSKMYDQASKLISKTNFPEGASNNQYVRYLYYLGKMQAIQLDYSDSYGNLTRALRKAPQNTGLGFRTTATKLSIIVQLLMGEVPDRSIFSNKEMRTTLGPYLTLTQTVRIGNLAAFDALIAETSSVANIFKADDTFNLITRLRQNVIKTGLKKINICYSKISFADIASKLKLDSAEEAEYTCAKAIRDGVIEAVLNHEKGFLQSKEIADIYSTQEPQAAYHKRIKFCLDVHNEAVKAMRYPEDPYKKVVVPVGEDPTAEEVDEILAMEDDDDGDM
jgi:26S proteasome regulatory subunit N3